MDYITGTAHHSKSARGAILGSKNGFLKLVCHAETKEILGVHIIGALATEIIHFGVIAVANKSTLDDILSTVFNYPTLHQLYKYAAYDALGNLHGKKMVEF